MQLTRNQVMFAGVIGLALLLVCVSVGIVFFGLQNRAEPVTPPLTLATPSPAAQLTQEATEALTVSMESPPPIFAPTYEPGDGLPTYVCGADAFGSYFTLQQMQMSGKDVEHGFHLGLVPFLLDDDPIYDVSEEQRTALLNVGAWDCLLTTLDSVALTSPGVITAIVDESAGAGTW